MSVIVKGMEMPKNCKDCPLSDHEAWCLIPGSWRERYYCPDDERSNDCPLVEIPTPHGRLGDLDALIEKYGEWYTEEGTESGYIGTMKNLLKDAQTVIEAEGET